ncbi:hypothetical protein Q8A67_005764 [Cirrhinus molitorella]|uniref:Uncharacterized protein n=1 Tax=Cirrhinus molitorella TaxID=172907 RepID=A0AA88QB89_9TELE|nr:hypothetical protein Q8A67_005764 [Cirrhinus molitorella]
MFVEPVGKNQMAVYYAVICLYADWIMELLPLLDWTAEALTDTALPVTPSDSCCARGPRPAGGNDLPSLLNSDCPDQQNHGPWERNRLIKGKHSYSFHSLTQETGLCSLLSLQNTLKAAPESAEERKHEKGIKSCSAVFTGFVKHDDRFAQT